MRESDRAARNLLIRCGAQRDNGYTLIKEDYPEGHLPPFAAQLAGKFIVLDGPDGCGKSTQCRRLAARIRAEGATVVECRDPGGTTIGERIRAVLLNHDLADMDARCETLLFMAARAQLVAEVIAPALSARSVVVSDRFVSSTFAYQGAAGVAGGQILDQARWAIGDCWPHLTVVLDVDVDEGFARIDGGRLDAMERRPREFHHRVRALFRAVGDHYPAPVAYVNGSASPEDVHESVWKAITHALC